VTPVRRNSEDNTWEIEADEARRITTTLARDHRFHVNPSHLRLPQARKMGFEPARPAVAPADT
jgi:hypothetical protein